MAGPTGRERSWDIVLNGVPYKVVRNEQDVPVWNMRTMPATAGKDVELFQRERRWDTWHMGAGWNDVSVEGTYSYATACDARFPRQVTAGAKVTTLTGTGLGAQVATFFEQGGNLYAVGGQYCKRINTSTDAWVAPDAGVGGKDFGAGAVATDAVNFDGNTIVGFSSNTKIWKFTGSAWAQASDTVYGKYADRWWSDNAEGYVLAGVSTGNEVVVCATGSDPAAASSWAGATSVGETGSAITGIAGGERTLWIAKTDGLYYIDLTRTPRVLETKMVKSTNGRGVLMTAAGVIYYPCEEGFYRYDPAAGTVDDVSPARGLPNTIIPGPVTAAVSYRGWLYATTWNANIVFLCAGRDRQEGEPGIGPMIWHGSLAEGSASQVTAMWVTALTSPPRLYAGHADGTASYIKLPQYGDNPILDGTSVAYGTGGILYLSIDNWSVPGTIWQPISFEFETKNADASNSITVTLIYDNGANTQALGTVTSSPRQVLSVPTTTTALNGAVAVGATSLTVDSATGFPGTGAYYIWIDNEALRVTAGAGTTGWTVTRGVLGTTAAAHLDDAVVRSDYRFTNVQLKLTFTQASATVPVILKGITGYAVQRPTTYRMIETQIYTSDRVASEFGIAHRVSGKTQLANLHGLEGGTYVALDDWWTGSKRSQTVLVGPVREAVVKQQGTESVDAVANVQIAVIS